MRRRFPYNACCAARFSAGVSPVLCCQQRRPRSGSEYVAANPKLLEATDAARRRPDLLPWRHVIVDEYQDVNPAQAAFVHALTTPKGPGPGGEGATLIGVGDDWQAIFGFQGGDASLIRTTADPAGVVQTLCEPITLVNGYRFGEGLADASRAVVTMDPKALDRWIRGLRPEPVGGVPPVSVTGPRPTPALTAELGPTATPTTAAVLAAFAHWIPGARGGTGEEAAEPVTVLVMGRSPDACGGLEWTPCQRPARANALTSDPSAAGARRRRSPPSTCGRLAGYRRCHVHP